MVNPQMVMYEEEFNQIQTVVDRLVRDANAKVVFIVDKNGQLIAASGDVDNLDTTSLASLTAGNIAATGGMAKLLPNHHITKPVLIGEIQGNGQFDTVWQTPGLVVAEEWSPHLPDSKDLIADWRKPMNCGNFNVVTGKCGGKGK